MHGYLRSVPYSLNQIFKIIIKIIKIRIIFFCPYIITYVAAEEVIFVL